MSIISRLTHSAATLALHESLDGLSARHKAVANNLANVETPGYKRSYVSFEAELRRVIEEKRPHRLASDLKALQPTRQTDVLSPERSDGNNTNIDAEIADLAKTALNQKAAVTLLELRGSIVRAAVMEGKR